MEQSSTSTFNSPVFLIVNVWACLYSIELKIGVLSAPCEYWVPVPPPSSCLTLTHTHSWSSPSPPCSMLSCWNRRIAQSVGLHMVHAMSWTKKEHMTMKKHLLSLYQTPGFNPSSCRLNANSEAFCPDSGYTENKLFCLLRRLTKGFCACIKLEDLAACL